MKNGRRALFFSIILVLSVCAACAELFFRSSGCGSGSGFTSGERTITSSGIERVYYVRLPANYRSMTPYPLVFAFHGAGGDYTNFTEGYYDFQDVVEDDAILVYPNALANAAGLTQWDNAQDVIFFDDLFRELEANLCFDRSRVFAAGHSAGAGFVNTLGCKRGSVLRAIAPVAGALLDHNDCTGQVAVIQIQGTADQSVPPSMIKPGRDYWIAINSCTKAETHAGADSQCAAYNDCDPQFPVQYCEHDGGHEWPDFASSAIWTFFKSLPCAPPSEKTGGGDIGDLGKGFISFKIRYPADFVGTPEKLALALYPANTAQPISTAPSFILHPDVPLGDYAFGEVTEYNNIEIDMLGLDYGDYTLTVNIYVEGGSYPIPTSGKDYIGLQNITIDSNTIVMETPFELAFMQVGF
jgi:poly(3-hydroxybutyrate) depolymerase